MTIFIYRWKVKPGKEKQFEKNWAILTEAYRDQGGSYGSRLHLSSNGEYIGYAQWPDAHTRDNCQLNDSISEARVLLRDAILSTYPEEQLSVKADFLVSK